MEIQKTGPDSVYFTLEDAGCLAQPEAYRGLARMAMRMQGIEGTGAVECRAFRIGEAAVIFASLEMSRVWAFSGPDKLLDAAEEACGTETARRLPPTALFYKDGTFLLRMDAAQPGQDICAALQYYGQPAPEEALSGAASVVAAHALEKLARRE